MKKKGFTLVELLAIIIILGVISLVTIQIITQNLDKAQKKTAKSNVDAYVDILQKHISETMIDNTSAFDDGVYTLDEINNTNIDTNGKIPTDGWILVENGVILEYAFKSDDFVVSFTNNTQTISEIDTLPNKPTNLVFKMGDQVYLDPGDSISRMWYVIKDSGYLDNTVNLIAASDYYGGVSYDNIRANMPGSRNWSKPSDIRLFNKDDAKAIFGDLKYNLYDCYNLVKDDISSISNIAPKGTGKYKWLYENTSNCTTMGCDNDGSTLAYWTDIMDETGSYVYIIGQGILGPASPYNGLSIRPVITIDKSYLEN